MKKIVHYSNPQSRGMRTQKLLEVFDIPHENVLIDFRAGKHREPEYLKIHPYGRVPALAHGDDIIVESGAITLYLADVFAEKMNTPAPGTLERARLYEWVLFFQSTMEPVIIPAFTTEDRTEIREKTRELLTAMAGRFKGPYALGDEFSVLDVVLNVELTWYRMMQIFPEGLEPYAGFLERTAPRMRWEAPAAT